MNEQPMAKEREALPRLERLEASCATRLDQTTTRVRRDSQQAAGQEAMAVEAVEAMHQVELVSELLVL